MPPTSSFGVGDVVVHTTRPEWGPGVVDKASNITHEGRQAQRLVVRFSNKGPVTLNTAVAPIISKEAAEAMRHNNPPRFSPAGASATASGSRSNSSSGGGWLAELEAKGDGKKTELNRLPDKLNDPFLNLEQRIEATLETHRFSTEPRSLLDWAVAQTGLDDPMSKYTRHELEQGFEWFARDRDLHLRELVRQAKQEGRLDMVDQVRRRQKLPAAVSALDKARNAM